jgi:Trk K+ transport system NAD-binding subunit
VSAGAAVAGRELADVPLPAGVRIAVIDRHGELLVPSGPTRLEPGDKLVVMAVGWPDLTAVVEAWLTGTAIPG